MSQRMTPLRQKILDLLAEKHLLSAMQLVVELEKVGFDVNKTSVYRSLVFLEKSGKICQHQFEMKEAVFELQDHHHDHLVCTNCGRVNIAECAIHPPHEVQGFQIDHHHLTLYGKCANCLSQE